MIDQQFTKLLEELMEKIENNPGGHVDTLSQISKQHTPSKKFKEAIAGLNESMGAIRLIIKYLLLDLEATRRERDQLRMILEDKND